MMRRWLPTWRVGHSGSMLLIFGSIWTLIGLGLATSGDAPILATLWPMTWLPMWLRVALWIVGGCVAIAYAFRPRWVDNDGVAWTLLYVPPALRSLAYFTGWLHHLLSPGAGFERGWSQALIYLAMTLAVVVCARWPDPGRLTEREGR